MTTPLPTHDATEEVTSDTAITGLLIDAFATRDHAYIAHALGVAARTRGMLELARHTGMSRPQLYHSLSEQGNPTLRTLLAVLEAMGLELTVKTSPSR